MVWIPGGTFLMGSDTTRGASGSPGHSLAEYVARRVPWQNLASDGDERTSPVGAFPANGYASTT